MLRRYVLHFPSFRSGPPIPGSTIYQATVLEWYKRKGDMVNVGDALILVDMDNVEIEIASPCRGRLLERWAKTDSIVTNRSKLALFYIS
jgi:pyruvate/2-oxoglutarate dehydrogenase complex dihydrolipoamide acyltransferase (E2) component